MGRPVLVKRAAEKTSPSQSNSDGGLFFSSPKVNLRFIPSGSVLLDCVLGGGWPLGRVSNVVGDKSTGKTLTAIEAIANARRSYPGCVVRYFEAEAAFDNDYAAALGVELQEGELIGGDTVEDLFADIERTLDALNEDQPALYIVDSLDSLSDAAELGRKITDSTYGGTKPKQIGQLFRRLVRRLEQKSMHLMLVSQIRDNIGVAFGNKHTRTGGKALDFYASQIVWLAHVGQIKRVIKGVTRAIGVDIKARTSKNKVGLPFRDCQYKILFGYGIDDEESMAKFMKETGGGVPTKENVIKRWFEIERQFLPKQGKYV